ncbi:hypothetical protein Btru_032555 [Bulinus truncatus]|nr:hypothetical protein Btru_032555 [Bulinus truncatus]
MWLVNKLQTNFFCLSFQPPVLYLTLSDAFFFYIIKPELRNKAGHDKMIDWCKPFAALCLIVTVTRVHLTDGQTYCADNHWPTGVHPHPDYCDRYVQCNNGQTSITICQPGNVFDPTTSSCRTASQVTGKCNDATAATPTVAPDQDFCHIYNWATGRHPHTKVCDRYVECVNFRTYIIQCGRNLLYDPVIQDCVDQVRARPCIDNSAMNITQSNVATHCVNTTTGDILFIFDSSSSIGYHDYETQLTFAANVSDTFSIGPQLAQFSVIVFSVLAQSMFPFDRNHDHNALRAAILSSSYIGSTTNTYEALDLARTLSFTAGNGARPQIPHVAVVMTDGQSSDHDRTRVAAANLRASNVTIISIGIGNFSQQELQDIASGPKNVMQIDSYSLLHTLQDDISILVCGTVLSPACSIKMDLIFLLDSSSSIGYTNFQEQLKFAADITQKFKVGSDEVRFAAVTYGSEVNVLFHLDTYNEHNRIYQHITNATYLSSSTNTAEALRYVTDYDMFGATHKGRSDAKKVIVVMTDGQSDHPVATASQAKYLRERGITILTVGVGSLLDVDELISLSDNRNNIFCAESYDVIHKLNDILIDQSCLAVTGNISTGSTGSVDLWDLCRQQNWANGIHANPFDCNSFIECTFLRTNVMPCPSGLVFDPVKTTCTYPHDAVSCKDYNDYVPIIGKRSTSKRNTVNFDTCNHLISGINVNPGGVQFTTPHYVATNQPVYDMSSVCSVYNLPDGIYPDPGSCTHFVECVGGISYHQSCPAGLEFNSHIDVCDDVHNINCYENYNYIFTHAGLHQHTSSKGYTNTLHRKATPTHFIQRLHQHTSSKGYTNTLHPKATPTHFIQRLHQHTSSKATSTHFIQGYTNTLHPRLHQHTSSKATSTHFIQGSTNTIRNSFYLLFAELLYLY